jgi:hypothetical protein
MTTVKQEPSSEAVMVKKCPTVWDPKVNNYRFLPMDTNLSHLNPENALAPPPSRSILTISPIYVHAFKIHQREKCFFKFII